MRAEMLIFSIKDLPTEDASKSSSCPEYDILIYDCIRTSVRLTFSF